MGNLDLSGCVCLHWQEVALAEVGRLNLSDCPQVKVLPDWLIVSDSIDVANTGLTELPESLRDCQLLWRGVPVDGRIAFHPEQIRTREILDERNAERRRVMLERVGWERFTREARPKVVDQDTDPGGQRRLLRFAFDDEDLAVLSMLCPSTGRRYFIRVPPQMRTCHQAAAWMAGFDEPSEYVPILET